MEIGAQSVNGLVGNYQSSGFFVLRTPLLPVVAFAEWGVGASEEGSGEDTRDHLRRSLTKLLGASQIVDSLRVASPALADRFDGWADRKPSRRKERLERTLVQYFARMCDRCTPFGLFAGVSVGKVGDETRLRLAGRHRYRRRSALDLAQVYKLVNSLLADESVRANLRYRPNDTLAAVPGGYQYVEASRRDGETRHEVSFLETDEALVAAITGAVGCATLTELRTALRAGISDPEVDDSDIAEYLDDLIEAQVIEPELVPAVVGEDPLDQMLTSIEDCAPLAEQAKGLRRLRTELHRLDSHGVGAPAASYAAVSAVWTGELGLEKTDRLLQVDMFKEATDLCLSDEVVEEVIRGAEPLWRLAAPVADPLRELKDRFRERYEAQEVPLAEAFDPERGLGMPGSNLKPTVAKSPLLAGLDFGAADGRAGSGARAKFPEAVADRILDLRPNSPAILELDDELLDRLATSEASRPPDALAIHIDLLAASEDAVRSGDFRILYHGTVGPSGARMLGRFCDLDPALLENVRSHLRQEEALAPDDLFVEIAHTPEGRVGNVVRRPHVREVELSCAGHSRREGPGRLTVGDLLIRLEGSRFRLRSRRDGRNVRPRLTSAHNYRRSSGMYRFLCALQADGTREGFGWSWGSLGGLPFLPRVVRGRAVYAVARWKIGRDQPAYQAVGKAKTEGARDEALGGLMQELRLSRFVRLRDGDNRLLLDLENPLCRAVLADHVARRSVLSVEEVLTDDLEGCVSGPEGKYRNEIILPLVRKQAVSSHSGAAALIGGDRTPASVQRTYAPGDEWLFYKLYAVPGTADRLLGEIIAPLAALHGEMASGEPWFFIRYSDPEPHLRIRFRGEPDVRRALEERAAGLIRPFLEVGTIYRVSLDTYVREVERYGGDSGIELAEAWFHADSAAALHLIEVVQSSGDESLRWKAVAMGFDRLLADFGLEYEGRERVVAAARETFGREFGVGPVVRRRLAKRLRPERADLEALVTGDGEHAASFRELERVFRERSTRTAEIVGEFRRLDEAGELKCPLDELLRSLMHMHANRVFPASARAQELVIHDFLSRTYRSLVARLGHDPDSS